MFKSFIIALQSQLAIFLGLLIPFGVSIFYLVVDDPRFPKEKPGVILVGLAISIFCFLLGTFLSRKYGDGTNVSLKESAVSIVLTWLFAVLISASVFVLAGFPDPNSNEYSLFRSFTDGVFESISGYTTAGGSVLPSVEAFPRSILMWRSTTHLLGGMGIAYIAITIWRWFKFKREGIINAEAEGPNYTEFDSESDAIEAGKDFIKIYGALTILLFVLLLLSGIFFRTTGYAKWYDDAFDALNHSFSVMGTGGFGTYDASAGLPISENGQTVIGGLRNPVSEWIIAIFMFIAGSNLSLWFILLYKKRIKDLIDNTEFRVYLGIVAALTIGIWLVLLNNKVYESIFDALRYAFFNVTTIISTTGLATADFTKWPAAAEGLLFVCYLIGGMVGSTAGGLKVLRFVVLYKYVTSKIHNLIYGTHHKTFVIDGVTYNEESSGLIMANIVLYFLSFMFGAVLIMIMSSKVMFSDKTTGTVDFTSAVTASIANLGNIGPAVEIGNINAGPTGNYFAYSIAGKYVMAGLMLIGRIGVITVITVFITRKGIAAYQDSVKKEHFDKDAPVLHS